MLTRIMFYTGLILENKNKPKLMWTYLKELLPGNANPSHKSLLIDGQIISDPKCMSNVLTIILHRLDKS